MKTFDHLTVIGLREWVALPGLGVAGLRAKIDTGASTSTLHATEVETFVRDGEKWVRFNAHLGSVVQLRHRRCEAPLVTMKNIKSSNGQAQTRYVIRTPLALGDRVWEVEFTLACRKAMRYRLLLGSKALIHGQLVVNPGLAYVQEKPAFPVSPPSSTGVA
ncbi:ATP-dependent zinc protease [Pseudomonas sp. R5(2019)]|uniref:retropepsin-like aspartic endopeptidase RimB n=1 Tax=Pseudomonas sp. R5(2019) TaxID=2697566 RepID=UPI0014133D54|nr:ATP-dependent zinc protease [Pseudomonas sp. R5(2019)]NBA94325.1 ATP-dependent zinc protease [Pseudomonas sp. R5(2019)]